MDDWEGRGEGERTGYCVRNGTSAIVEVFSLFSACEVSLDSTFCSIHVDSFFNSVANLAIISSIAQIPTKVFLGRFVREGNPSRGNVPAPRDVG